MENRRQSENINAGEYVIKRPLFWPVFLLIMFLICLLLCFWDAFWDTPSTGPYGLFDLIADLFDSIAGFSVWIPITVLVFIFLAINLYMYFRFKLVIHRHSFTVTPLLGATHHVAFSSVEKVTHYSLEKMMRSKRFDNRGYHITIEYDNKKIHIPYTLNSKGAFRQKSIGVLLKALERYKTNMTE